MEWIVELFREGELISKRMFGGTAHYYQGKMVLVFMQYEGDRTYRGKEYNFDIWNGVLFPVEREAHNTIINRYPPPLLASRFRKMALLALCDRGLR